MIGDAEQQAALVWIVLTAVTVINAVLAGTVLYRRLALNRATFAPRWSVADVWFGVQLTLLGVAVLTLPLIFLSLFVGVKLDDFQTLSSPKLILYMLLPSAILQNLAFFGVPAAFINLKYGLPLRAIGLPPRPSRRDVIAGLTLGVVGMGVSLLLEGGLSKFAEQFQHVSWVKAAIDVDKNNPVASMTKALPGLGVPGLILAVLGVGLGAPLGEEMLFRGFAFNALKRRFGLGIGLIGSALLFTLPHSYGLGLVPVFALGLLLAWTYHNSGSLWVPILMHATNNTAQVLLAFLLPHIVH
jgi:membrane protease YdiL (CAAX protease family)